MDKMLGEVYVLVLRIIGWILVPYIMIFIDWKKIHVSVRIIGGLWAIFVLLQSLAALGATQTSSTTAISPAASSSSPSPADNKVQNSTVKKTTKKVPSFVMVGHPGDVGDFQVTVNNLQELKTVGSDGMSTTANGFYWVFNVTVKNNAHSSKLIDSSMFKLEGNGSVYQPDTTADMYANSNNDFFLQSINPGISASGYIVFDMPEAMTYNHIGQHFDMVVTDGLFGMQQNKFALP